MSGIFQLVASFFRKSRIELALFISAALMTIIGLIIYSVHHELYGQAISLISPLIITVGVLVAIDNLVTSEKNRHRDKEREESRFRFDIGLGHLEKLSEVLKPTTISVGEGSSWTQNSGWHSAQLTKALVLIESYLELKQGVLDEHLQALNIEETIYRNSLISLVSAHTGYEYFSLLFQGGMDVGIEDRLKEHNEKLIGLAKEEDQVNFRYWDTNEVKKLPCSEPPDLLLEVLSFLLPEYDELNKMPSWDLYLALDEAGLKGISDYIYWFTTVSRKNDGTLILNDDSVQGLVEKER